jgi:MFS family permease
VTDLLRPVATQVFVQACMAGVRMAAPLLALRQGYTPAAVGLLLALFALSQVFLALPVGRLTDRVGLRGPVQWAVAAAVLGAGLALAWPEFPVLCAAALLTGGANGVVSIALQRHVGRVARGAADLRRVFSWLAMGPAIANFLGPLAAGLLIDAVGFRVAFGALALMPLAGWWCVRGVEEDLPAPVGAVAASPPGGVARSGWNGPGSSLELLRGTHFRRLLLVNVCLSASWDVHTFVVPLLGHERGISASVIGMILGAFAVAATAIRLLIPLVSDRLHERTVIAGAIGATALLFGAYPLMRDPVAMGFCSVLLGLVLGSVQPMVMSLLHQITPHDRHGQALGLRLMILNASSVAMPVLFGGLGAVVGVAGVFWVVGAGVGSAWRLAMRLQAGGEPAGAGLPPP